MAEITQNQTRKPPMQSSDESNQEQLALAKSQGDAFERAVMEMISSEAHGEQKAAGDYLVGYAIEHAEGLYHLDGGQLVWRNPDRENAHVEVVVRDASDGRFIPGLHVTATLIDGSGEMVGTHQQPFLWHPWLYHYGRNWVVPRDGEHYTLKIRIEAPDFHRHDKINGRRFAEPVEVTFQNVKIETGQKAS